MSKKRYIDTRIWSDTWFVDVLSRDEQHFFFYLLTNDKTTVAGVYEIPLRTICSETGYTIQELQSMMKKMASKVAYINGWIVLRKSIKNQNYKNSKIRTAIDEVLRKCPPEALEFIDFPDDFENRPAVKSRQTRLIDDSSMTLDESSHSDSDLTLLNSDSDADKPRGFKKTITTPAQKRSYAIAAQADRDQAARAAAAHGRRGTTKSLSEMFFEHRLEKGK